MIGSLITIDLVFPIFYAAAISALFIWVELEVDRSGPGPIGPTGTEPGTRAQSRCPRSVRRGFARHRWREPAPLGGAKWITADPTAVDNFLLRALVFIGSACSALKWALLLLSACAILIELMSGPRGLILRRLRFSLLSVALGALPLLIVAQGKDILQRLVEGEHPYVRVFFAAIPAVLFAALAVWYCGRKIVQFRSSTVFDEPDRRWYDHFAEHAACARHQCDRDQWRRIREHGPRAPPLRRRHRRQLSPDAAPERRG